MWRDTEYLAIKTLGDNRTGAGRVCTYEYHSALLQLVRTTVVNNNK